LADLVDTSRVQRRRLRFESLAELGAEIDRIVQAEQAGRLRRAGNWTTGQIFGHLAAWINYAYEGYPLKVPFFIRWILRFKVRQYLRDGMPAGRRIPNVAAGTYGVKPLGTREGEEKLRAALARLACDEPPRFDSPAFGRLSNDDRIALNLRHAELHLGFLEY
jgi:hypothetical protein